MHAEPNDTKLAYVYDASPHQGIISIAGKEFSWNENPSGEVVFAEGIHRNANTRFLSMGELKKSLKMDDTQQLQIVNELLVHYRPHSLPDGNGFFVSSAGITNGGKLFVDVTNQRHIKQQFAGRGCGETAMLRKAQHSLGTSDVDFDYVYLMCGMAEKKGRKLVEKNEGHLGCMCGECRQNLRDHAKGAKFVMVPTNPGKVQLTLNTDAMSPKELKPHEAWELSFDQMYPLPEYKEMPKAVRATVDKGYEHITDISQPFVPMQTSLPEPTAAARAAGQITLSLADYERLRRAYEEADMSLRGLNENASLENINCSMVQLIKKAYAHHAHAVDHSRNLEITAVIIKSNSGEFFPSVMVDGHLWLPSKPHEIPIALTNAYNQMGIAEVYMMTFNDRQLRDEKTTLDKETNIGHALKMPDPGGLNRIIKNMRPTDDPSITIIPVNDGRLSEKQIQEFSETLNVREAFGPGYENPKTTIARAPTRH